MNKKNKEIWYQIKSLMIKEFLPTVVLLNSNNINEKEIQVKENKRFGKIEFSRKIKVEIKSKSNKTLLTVGAYAKMVKREKDDKFQVSIDEWYVKYIQIKKSMFGFRKEIEELYLSEYGVFYLEEDIGETVENLKKDIISNKEIIQKQILNKIKDLILRINIA